MALMEIALIIAFVIIFVLNKHPVINHCCFKYYTCRPRPTCTYLSMLMLLKVYI